MTCLGVKLRLGGDETTDTAVLLSWAVRPWCSGFAVFASVAVDQWPPGWLLSSTAIDARGINTGEANQ